jgi:2-haloacid dehalogenase
MMAEDRWATFDCYGTLIDWNGGIARELERLWGPNVAARLLARYHEIEPELQLENPSRSYRRILDLALARLARSEGLRLPPEEGDALSRSLPTWQAFGEVRPSLARTREAGWKLAILSNTDRDYIEASMEQIGVPFELAIVASEIGSYKPASRHWEVFRELVGADPARHVHVGASLFHDVAPAIVLGIPVVWINRLGEDPDPPPTRELHDLGALAETLDELAPM